MISIENLLRGTSLCQPTCEEVSSVIVREQQHGELIDPGVSGDWERILYFQMI
jgi:hypothetical protein